MADKQAGYEICQYITDTLNNLITSTGKQIDRNEKAIWDGFLHKASNEDWDDMFAAFKDVIDTKGIHLTQHQQLKFDEAYTTFKRDRHHRERCMDVEVKFKSTKKLAWAMIMTIREVFNEVNKVSIPNQDSNVTIIKSKGKQQRIEIRTDKTATHITVFHSLFDLDD